MKQNFLVVTDFDILRSHISLLQSLICLFSSWHSFWKYILLLNMKSVAGSKPLIYFQSTDVADPFN